MKNLQKYLIQLINGKYCLIRKFQAQEIVFSRKKSVTNNGTIYFNNMLMVKENVRKYLGVFLDVKTKFFGTH